MSERDKIGKKVKKDIPATLHFKKCIMHVWIYTNRQRRNKLIFTAKPYTNEAEDYARYTDKAAQREKIQG